MIIEVHQKGKIINRVPVEIPSGNSYQGYTERKAIIDYEVAKLKKVYPLAQLWLAFESKMNKKLISYV